MRSAFLILLLANLLLFGWARGFWGEPPGMGEREHLKDEIAADQLRILPAATPPAAAPSPLACRRLEWLTAAEAESVRNAIGTVAGWKVSMLPGPPGKLYWVVIADLPNQALAEKKSREASSLGAERSEILADAQNGPFLVRFASFDKLATAEEFHQALVRKGVRSARLLTREATVEKYLIELRAPASELKAKLPVILGLLPQVRETDCAPP